MSALSCMHTHRLVSPLIKRTQKLVAVLLLIAIPASLLFTSSVPVIAQGATGQTTIRALDFNTEGGCFRDGCPGDEDWPSRGSTCPTSYLQYSFDKVRFLAQYMRKRSIDIGAFQELQAKCATVPLKNDVFNRPIPNLSRGQPEAIAAFKAQFKAGYEKTVGRTFSDSEFEKELTSVLGKQTFEDVWVQFLPFDETYWMTLLLIYVENYPMQPIAKPYSEITQGFRVGTFSRYPLKRSLTETDYVPIIIDNEHLGSDTRWITRAPLNSPFGLLNFYNTHTRAGDESCDGTKTAFSLARTSYDADKNLYVMAGDFNRELKRGQCDDSIRDQYHLADWGEPTAIDYLAILKTLPMTFDPNSREVLWARGGEQRDGAVISDHNGFAYNIVGPRIQTPPPLTSIKLPDYPKHAKDGSKDPAKPGTVNPPGSPASRVPICDDTAAPAASGGTCFEGFVADFNTIKSKPIVDGMLLFSPLGDNPDPNFAKHLIPPAMIRQLCGGGSCAGTKVGINPGTMFGQGGKQHPATYGFDWFLQIAERSKPGDVIATINSLPANTKTIIRIGVGGNGGGFNDDPQIYIAFLKEVFNGLNANKRATTYAIAGPNEADIEWDWFAPNCNQGLNEAFYSCIGPKLSSFMNAVINGNTGFKLLSPAFNMTSYSLNGIFNSMDRAGANWGGLVGIAGNIYPNQVPMTQHWQTNGIDALLAKTGKPLVITETGPFGCSVGDDSTPYCITPDEYYIQPINGVNGTTPNALTAENPTGEQLDVIRDDLIMQGYEARCAAPGMKIKLTEFGRDAMQKLFVQPPPYFKGVVMGSGENGGASAGERIDSTDRIYSRLDVDYRDILVPLFRDVDRSDPAIKRSIEDYFGVKESGDTVYSSAEIKTAAINSLLSNEQRCTVAYQNLSNQDAMCQKLADPNLCALYTTSIPNTSYTVKSLYQAFETERGNQPIIEFCRDVMGSHSGTKGRLREGMANAPLTIEKAYRLAFMVTSIRLRVPSPKLLNLFTHPLGGWLGPPKPNHAIAVVAFKIPDIVTNKGFNDGYTVDTAYDDTAKLTRNSLITEPTQDKIEKEAKARRRLLLDKARELSTVVHHDSWAEISCLGGGTKTSGVGSPQCKDPLSKALVDIINAQAVLGKELSRAVDTTAPTTPDEADADEGKMTVVGETPNFGDLLDSYKDDGELKCSDQAETGLTINDPGELNAPNDPSHVFKDNWGAALLANLFGDCTHDGEGGGSPSFASTQDPDSGGCSGEDWFLKSKYFVVEGMLGQSGSGDSLAIKHFLVYPVGYDLRTVEGVLAGSFFTKKQLADILELQKNKPSATQKIVDQFRLEGTKIGFDGGSDEYSYVDRVDCPLVTKKGIDAFGLPYEYQEPECPTRTFGFSLSASGPKAANILGAKLGYWMRKIQLTLNATTQKSFGYLKTCASLEEFLLDRCGGGATIGVALPPGQSVNPPGDGQWVGDQCFSSTTLEEIKYTVPTNLPFTGEATYYASGVFNTTLNTRLSGAAGNDFKGNTTVKNCELPGATYADAQAAAGAAGQKYVGCVAMLRMGDLYFRTAWNQGNANPNAVREVWLKNKAGVVHGPFAVIDVARDVHAPCLYDQGWAVDIDFNSFKRLFNQTGGPDEATVCDTQSC